MPAPNLARSAKVVLRWDVPEDPTVKAVRIFRRDTEIDEDKYAGNLWTVLGDFTGGRAEVSGAVPTRRYHFAASPVFVDGTIAAQEHWQALSIVPEADSSTPPVPDTPTNLGGTQEEGNFTLRWAPVDDGVTVGYEVRRGAWEGGELIGKTTASFLAFPWPVAGVAQTYYLAAYDAQGRHGATASLTVTHRALGDMVPTTTMDESGGGFSGSKAGTSVVSSKLQPDAFGEIDASTGEIYATQSYDQGGLYKSPGTYTQAGQDLGVVHTARFEMDLLAAMTQATGLKVYDHTGMIGGSADDKTGVPHPIERRPGEQRWTIYGEHRDPLDLLIEIDTSPTNTGTLGSVSWDGWRRFVPGDYYCRWVRFRLTFGGDGFFFPQVTTLKFYHRKRNMKDEGTATVTATPGPTAITFTTPFTVAPVVTCGVIDAAGTEFVAQVADITTSGCNIRAYDAAGGEVFTGTIHWHAMGT